MSRTRTDCEGFHRRDVLRVGVAGLLGMSLPDVLRAEALSAAGRPVKKPATGVIQIWLSGRAGDDRHVGPQARRPRGDPRRVPPDRHGGAGGLDLRAHAGAGEGHGPLHAGPFARPLDQRPRSGHDLHGHGEPAGAGTRVPRGGGPGGAAAAAAEGRPALRHVRRAARRRLGHRTPATSARRSARSRSRATRSGDAPVPRGVAPRRDSRSRDLESREALRDRFDRGLRALDSTEVMAGLDRFHRQAVEILLSDRVRAALDLSREPDRHARRLRPDAPGPGGPGGAAADRGRRPVRDAGLRRLGHPRRQLPPPPRPPPAARWTRRSRP